VITVKSILLLENAEWGTKSREKQFYKFPWAFGQVMPGNIVGSIIAWAGIVPGLARWYERKSNMIRNVENLPPTGYFRITGNVECGGYGREKVWGFLENAKGRASAVSTGAQERAPERNLPKLHLFWIGACQYLITKVIVEVLYVHCFSK
jgi:hypothetical protein